MSVSRKVIAEVNGVEESVVKCGTCAYFAPVPFIPFCKKWINGGEVTNTDFCSFWERGKNDGRIESNP